MKRSVRSMITFTALGLASAASGSAGAAPAMPAPAAPAPVSPAAPVPTAHELVQMIGDALAEVDLSADQEDAVEQLSATVEPLQRDVDQAENDLMLSLADQVKAGSIDSDALAPDVEHYVMARQNLSGPLRSALETVHDILDPEQRDDFVDALECEVHDAVQIALSDQVLDDFADQLGLTDEQKDDFRNAFQPIKNLLEQQRRTIHSALEGFRGEVFSVDTYLPANQVAARARRRAEMIISATATLVDILTPEQLQKLADHITASADVDQTSGGEHVGTATQAIWAGVRGPRGGAVVAGTGGWYGRRWGAYPYAVGWGVGW